MIFYNAAENSLEVERSIIESLNAFQGIEETRNWRERGEKIYKIEVTVTEVEE